jgi:hypothetical protein
LIEGTLQDESQLDSKVVVICKSKSEISTIVKAGRFPYEPFYTDIAEERKEEVLDKFRTRQI